MPGTIPFFYDFSATGNPVFGGALASGLRVFLIKAPAMRIFLLHLILVFSITAYSQNVGIGTATPAARLHVADSAVLFTGPDSIFGITPFAPPASGAGTRFMWYPGKAALRAGFAAGTEWDKGNIGDFSIAMGSNVKASGISSIALGNSTTASNFSSIAMGDNAIATGNYTVAIGHYTTAGGAGSTALGYHTTTRAFIATAMGNSTIASGYSSTAMGNSTIASGNSSTAMGSSTTASGNSSTAMGLYTITKSPNSLVTGLYNDTTATNRLFEVGNGSADNARSNAFTVLVNGSAGVGTASPALVSGGSGLHVSNNTYTQLRLQSSNSSAGLEFTPGAGKNYELQADIIGSFFLYDRTANQYRLLVNTNGNLGIGNANPSRPLSFPATLEKKVTFYPGPSGDHGIAVAGNDLRIYADNSNGRVSFGFDDYAGGFTSRAYVLGSGTTALVVQGNMTVNGTNYNSDARFKQHIQPLQGALEKVKALQGVQYEMRVKEFPDRNFQPGTEIGLIAQEVEKVLPELVRTDADGYKSVDYAKVVPVLIEGMKAQQFQMSAQQEQLRMQQEKIDVLLRRLEKLEQDGRKQ